MTLIKESNETPEEKVKREAKKEKRRLRKLDKRAKAKISDEPAKTVEDGEEAPAEEAPAEEAPSTGCPARKQKHCMLRK